MRKHLSWGRPLPCSSTQYTVHQYTCACHSYMDLYNGCHNNYVDNKYVAAYIMPYDSMLPCVQQH